MIIDDGGDGGDGDGGDDDDDDDDDDGGDGVSNTGWRAELKVTYGVRRILCSPFQASTSPAGRRCSERSGRVCIAPTMAASCKQQFLQIEKNENTNYLAKLSVRQMRNRVLARIGKVEEFSLARF